MRNAIILFGTSALLIFGGLFLIKYGLRKKDLNSALILIHFPLTKRYGRGISIAFGIFSLILGILLLTLKR